MSQEPSSMLDKEPPSAQSWSEIWWNALTHPTLKTYEEIAQDPGASSSTAYKWMMVSALVGGLALGLLEYPGNFGAICLGPVFAAMISLFGFAIASLITQLIAKVLGGTGTFNNLAYTLAAYAAPLSLASFFIYQIAPVIGTWTNPLGVLYGLVLHTIAVKANHQLSWGNSAMPSIIFLILWLGFVICLGAFIISMPNVGPENMRPPGFQPSRE